MQIDTIKFKSTSQLSIIKFKKGVLTKFSKLKTLVKDVFEREKQNYLIIDGKKIKEKDLPNCISGPSDFKGLTWGRVRFYTEDIEKMKNMDISERLAYKGKLIQQNRFTLGDVIGKS